MEDRFKFIAEEDIFVYAMRYALGRMTFAPLTVMENIKLNLLSFNRCTLQTMIRDIEDQEFYGMECDKDLWLDFKKYLEDFINK